MIYGKFWDTNTQGPDIKVDHLGSRPRGHHHTSSAHRHVKKPVVLAARSSVSQPFLYPYLSRSWAENGGKLGFWAAVRPFLALHDLKPVLATCKPTENGFKAPCCGSSAIVVVVRRSILAYDRGAVTYTHGSAQISAVGCRNGSETVIVTADINSPTTQNGFKAPCWGQHTPIIYFVCPYLTTNSVP
jgi:hypothetical protein